MFGLGVRRECHAPIKDTGAQCELAGIAYYGEYDGANTLLRRYVHGPGTDAPLVWYEGAGLTDRRWYHADERGSVIGISNASGTVTNINAYDEYGIPQSTNVGRFGYTGQTWISEIGMNYYKARMYSPTLGRFMQTDPIGYGDGVNWYAYVGSDPVNGTDPTGLTKVTCTGSIIQRDSLGDCGGVNFLSINGVDTGAAGMARDNYIRSSSWTLDGIPVPPSQVEGLIDRFGGWFERTGNRQHFVYAGANRFNNSNWSNDLISAYEYSRITAIEMVQDSGLSKEVSYSIFRDNKYKNLFTRFKYGKDGSVSPIITDIGSTLLMMGHVHNRVTGGTNQPFGLGIRFGISGPSSDDMRMRQAYPSVILILHERSVTNTTWKDIQF